MKERNKRMKINIELSNEELKRFNLDSLAKHIAQHAEHISASVYADQLCKADHKQHRGGEFKVIDELADKMNSLYADRLNEISKTVLNKAKQR